MFTQHVRELVRRLEHRVELCAVLDDNLAQLLHQIGE
ncbi:Uncharacterised protein [Mycobacteroides abscessus subsp. massiliense]|nr:Uncharacterised protein [Mycobacteroides abscessus subsp. massiliense]